MNPVRYFVGLFMLVDGLLLTIFGHRYLRIVNFEYAPEEYNQFIEWQLERPEWVMRAAGAVESSLGAIVLRSGK